MNMREELTVRQIMHAAPVNVRPEQTIQEVLRIMNERRIGAVLVTFENRLLGIFTERDFLRQAATAAPGWRQSPVCDWMTTKPHTISPDAGWERAMSMLEQLRIRHLPVLENDEVIGIISARELIAKRQEHLNRLIEKRTHELKQANDQLLARDSETAHNMRMAGRLLQRIVLPHQRPDWSELTVGVHFAPLDLLGGDYYDFAGLGPEHVGLLIADASGHSIPASLVAVMTRSAFAAIANETFHPGEVLAAMNTRLQGLSDERFVTAFYAVLHRESRILTFANAGHPPALRYVQRTGTVEKLSARGFLLGIMPGEIYKEHRVQLEPGDRLCLYTDGVIETRNEIGEMFGMDRLSECLLKHQAKSGQEIVAEIMKQLNEFRDKVPYNDDVTIVVVGLEQNVPKPSSRLSSADF